MTLLKRILKEHILSLRQTLAQQASGEGVRLIQV